MPNTESKITTKDGIRPMKENKEKILAAAREQMERVPYISKKKCNKVFVLNLILNSGLEYGEVMSYLDSLNTYEETDKKCKMLRPNMSIEEKLDVLGWDKGVQKLIELTSTDIKDIAA